MGTSSPSSRVPILTSCIAGPGPRRRRRRPRSGRPRRACCRRRRAPSRQESDHLASRTRRRLLGSRRLRHADGDDQCEQRGGEAATTEVEDAVLTSDAQVEVVGRRVPRDRWSCPTRTPVRGRSEGFRATLALWLRRRHNPRRQNPRRHGHRSSRRSPTEPSPDVRHPLARLRSTLAGPSLVAAACPRPTSIWRCARSASPSSRPTSTSRSSRTSWPACASGRRRRRPREPDRLPAGRKIVHEELTALLGAG